MPNDFKTNSIRILRNFKQSSIKFTTNSERPIKIEVQEWNKRPETSFEISR